MSETRKRLLFAAFLTAAPACSLFVSVDDLQGGAAGSGDGGGSDVTSSDANGKDSAPADATPSDAGNDAQASTFLDDFNRADDPFIGNQWLMKTPGPLALVGNAVARMAPDADSLNYEDNVVYRPATEDVADCEIAIEVTFASNPSGYPQLWARMPSAIVAQPSLLTGYVFYITNSGAATMSRNSGTDLTDFINVNASTSLNPGQVYRLRFRVTGSNPVHLTGSIEDVASGTVLGQNEYDDSDPARLSSPGSVGFSGSNQDGDSYTYDNFVRTNL